MPFREAPAAAVVSSGRSRPQQAQTGRSTLAAPRVLLRSNSDNNLNVNKLSAPQTPSRSHSPSRSPLPSPLRSLSPRRPQQMQNSSNGTVKSMGRGARHPPRSRSPSLGRLGDGDTRRHPPQRHSRSVTSRFLLNHRTVRTGKMQHIPDMNPDFFFSSLNSAHERLSR